MPIDASVLATSLKSVFWSIQVKYICTHTHTHIHTTYTRHTHDIHTRQHTHTTQLCTRTEHFSNKFGPQQSKNSNLAPQMHCLLPIHRANLEKNASRHEPTFRRMFKARLKLKNSWIFDFLKEKFKIFILCFASFSKKQLYEAVSNGYGRFFPYTKSDFGKKWLPLGLSKELGADLRSLKLWRDIIGN